MSSTQKLYSVREARTRLGVPRYVLDRCIRTGQLSVIVLSAHRRYVTEDELVAFATRHTEPREGRNGKGSYALRRVMQEKLKNQDKETEQGENAGS